MPRVDPADIRALRATYRYRCERDAFMRRNPLCAECERQGRITLSTELDHIIPAHERPDLFWDQSNWQALCGGPGSCHARKSAEENRSPETPEDRAWSRLIERSRRIPA